MAQLEILSAAAKRRQASDARLMLHSMFSAMATVMSGKEKPFDRMDEQLEDVLRG